MFWYLSALIQLFVFSTVFTNCSTTAYDFSEHRNYASFEDLEPYLLNMKPDMDIFLKDGPFDYEMIRNFDIRVTETDLIHTDVYFSGKDNRAPLIILQHGNLANKSVHENQAKRLASWGFHCLVASLPNQGQWIQNGYLLGGLIKLIHTWPQILGRRFDVDNIIVAGHSFGGSAVAIAAGQDAPIKGIIFLDPALVNKTVKRFIKRIDVPVVLLGADRRRFKSRRRKEFFKLVHERAIEISFKDATHNDAQSPNLFSFSQMIGFDYGTDRQRQERFTAAIVASAFSMASTGSNQYAWSAFQSEIRSGNVINPRRK